MNQNPKFSTNKGSDEGGRSGGSFSKNLSSGSSYAVKKKATRQQWQRIVMKIWGGGGTFCSNKIQKQKKQSNDKDDSKKE